MFFVIFILINIMIEISDIDSRYLLILRILNLLFSGGDRNFFVGCIDNGLLVILVVVLIIFILNFFGII